MSGLFLGKKRFPLPRLLLLLAIGFGLGLGGVYLYLSPRVVSFRPGQDREAGQQAMVEVRFSTAMDPACTESKLTVDPPMPGTFDWEGNTLRFLPAGPWPVGVPVQVTLQAGACSARGLPLLAGATWSFTPSGPRIAYVTSSGGNYRLMAIPAAGGEPVELLEIQTPIQDLHVSPRGDFLVYATGPSDGASSLWILPLDTLTPELLLDCGADTCRDPAISPDRTRVAYERAVFEGGKSGLSFPQSPRVEMITLAGREVTPVSKPDHMANYPSWSPQGWLSYYDATNRAIVISDLKGGETYIPDYTGEPWSWHPDGRQIVFPEMQVEGESGFDDEHTPLVYRQLILVRLEENERTLITPEISMDDSMPAFSPDGSRLAFTRKFLDSRWTPGQQIWLMNLEQRTAIQLTREADFGHSSIRWSPDGSALVFMRFHETAPSDPAEIWRINADGSNLIRLVAGGYLPQWLP